MKNLNNYIQEKFLIDTDTEPWVVDNEIDVNNLKYFTKNDIKELVNWVNYKMPDDIRPVIMSNLPGSFAERYNIYLLYSSDNINIDARKMPKLNNIPYIRFWYDDEGLQVDIYDNIKKAWARSKEIKDKKNYMKCCFEYIESKYDLIRNILKANEKSK